MFELAETLALAIGGIDANIAHVVNIVDRGIRIDRRSRGINDKETIAHIRKIKLMESAL